MVLHNIFTLFAWKSLQARYKFVKFVTNCVIVSWKREKAPARGRYLFQGL